jgi:hypothetical protein
MALGAVGGGYIPRRFHYLAAYGARNGQKFHCLLHSPFLSRTWSTLYLVCCGLLAQSTANARIIKIARNHVPGRRAWYGA